MQRKFSRTGGEIKKGLYYFLMILLAVPFNLLVAVNTADAVILDYAVVINEIMADPHRVGDSSGEWFELYNRSSAPIDINGWTIKDNDTDSHVINNGGSLTIPAFGYLVLGRNGNTSVNGGVTVDYAYGSDIALTNSGDEIVLLNGLLTEIDRVEYASSWDIKKGKSIILKDDLLDNNDKENWCISSSSYGLGDLGTPGSENDECEEATIEECILKITKTDNRDTVAPGENLIYELTLENIGTANCTGTGVKLKDVYDTNTSYVSSTGSPYQGSGYAQWNFGVVEPGEKHEVELTVMVSEDAECGSIITNKAKYYSKQTNWSVYIEDNTTVECMNSCGNGELDDGEECDDGNTEDGDGCSSTCEIQRINCPFTATGDQILVNFTKRLRSDNTLGNSQEIVAATVPAGNYTVKLSAFDGYPNRVNVSQPHEQYKVVLEDIAGVIAESSATDDLADNVAYASVTNTVNSFLIVNSEASKVVAKHAYYPDNSSANSLNPICALFEPIEQCGDGFLTVGEECDDGNTVSGDGCSSECTIEPVCGDGNLDQGEMCDEGGDNGIGCDPAYGESCDFCNDFCNIIVIPGSYCGDGITNEGYEECDDGNQINDDNCTNECMLPGMCRSDIDVVFIMDRSGSMGYEIPTRLSQAQDAANYFLSNLDLNDQSALVSFATEATLDKTLSNDHSVTETAINALTVGGATNIGDAINLANQELSGVNGNPQLVKIEILLTDGKANKPNGSGYGEDPLDVAYAESKVAEAAALGYKIFTIGLGDDINETMLQNIATITGAEYYFAPTGEQLDAIFEQIAFATCEYGSISGCKYSDSNNDGNLDGEETVPGWEIVLGGDANLTQLTDEQGCYKFSGLEAGSYTVTEGNNIGNYTQTYPADPGYYEVALGDQEDLVDYDFGNYFGQCGNEILDEGEECDDGNTLDGDGCSATCEMEVCEPIMARVIINNSFSQNNSSYEDKIYVGSATNIYEPGEWFPLYENGAFIEDTDILNYENVSGIAVQRIKGQVRLVVHGTNPLAEDLEHATGYIEFLNANPVHLLNDASGNNTLEKDIVVGGYNDTDGEKTHSAGQDEVWLTQDDNYSHFWLTVNVADDGYYTTYVSVPLEECSSLCTDNDQDGYSIEGGDCGEIDCKDDDPAINPGATEVCNQIDDNCDGNIDEGDICGGEEFGDIFGVKFNDLNANGILDDGEPNLLNWGIELYDYTISTSTPISVATTTALGYSFDNLTLGSYVVVEVNQPGWTQTAPTTTEEITLTVDNKSFELNFGNVQDLVCTDLDEDGYSIEGGDCGEIDCKDDDPAINPGAEEICGNEVDEDCDGYDDECPGPTCTDNDKDGYFIEGGECGPSDCDDNNPSKTTSCGGGGGGGGGPTGLYIHSEKVAGTATSTATINWHTNKSADSRVVCSLSPIINSNLGSWPDLGYGSPTGMDSTLKTFHTIVLTDLLIDTNYYCRTISKTSGQQAYSSELTIRILDEERVPACGDGILDANEDCDDGNTVSGDGCSAICTTESCAGADYIFETSLKVIGENCQLPGWTVYQNQDTEDVSVLETGLYSVYAEVHRSGPEESQPAENFIFSVNGKVGDIIFDRLGDETLRTQLTGDFVFLEGENTIIMDTGTVCPPENAPNSVDIQKVCLYKIETDTLCGNGVLEGTEECDDRNLVNGDGCSNVCLIEEALVPPTGGEGGITPIGGQGPVGGLAPGSDEDGETGEEEEEGVISEGEQIGEGEVLGEKVVSEEEGVCGTSTPCEEEATSCFADWWWLIVLFVLVIAYLAYEKYAGKEEEDSFPKKDEPSKE